MKTYVPVKGHSVSDLQSVEDLLNLRSSLVDGEPELGIFVLRLIRVLDDGKRGVVRRGRSIGAETGPSRAERSVRGLI
jgi:hypothetical protein